MIALGYLHDTSWQWCHTCTADRYFINFPFLLQGFHSLPTAIITNLSFLILREINTGCAFIHYKSEQVIHSQHHSSNPVSIWTNTTNNLQVHQDISSFIMANSPSTRLISSSALAVILTTALLVNLTASAPSSIVTTTATLSTTDQDVQQDTGSMLPNFNDECKLVMSSYYQTQFVRRHPTDECCVCMASFKGPTTRCDCEALCALKRLYRYNLPNHCCVCWNNLVIIKLLLF